jgi:hypothetical protein
MPPRKKIAMLYQPRPGQARLHAMLRRFSVLVCHRRWGKTYFAVNQLVGSGLKAKRVKGAGRPHLVYIAPLRHQAKSIAWDVLKHYARPYVLKPDDINEAELRVDLLGNSRIQLFGADNPDAARGLGINGAVFDEYGDMDPTMRSQVIGPALADRNGYELFIGTPKGQNAFSELYEHAKMMMAAGDPQWFAELIRASESGVLPLEELAIQRANMTPEEYAQEFECSFNAPRSGTYYAADIDRLQAKKQIGVVKHETGLSVYTAWDLGVSDATSIWMFQLVGREVHVIDYIEGSGVGLEWYVTELRKRPYVYDKHMLPHDAAARELGTGRTRVETLQGYGLGQITVLPATSVQDGINAVRQLLPRCWFDETHCRDGLKSLRAYRAEYDPKREVFSKAPRHDWSSHAADAIRCLAMGLTRLGDRPPVSMRAAAAPPIKYPSLGVV